MCVRSESFRNFCLCAAVFVEIDIDLLLFVNDNVLLCDFVTHYYYLSIIN